MPHCDLLIQDAEVIDGTGAPGRQSSVAVAQGRIVSVDAGGAWKAREVVRAAGLVLAPGFIDTHTHDDTSVILTPAMLPKLTQGVTTVVVGNCGISASPVLANNTLPEPMGLLGAPAMMQYRTFASYAEAVDAAGPAVNVAGLVGHTTLRANHMSGLNRSATPSEVTMMRAQLDQSLQAGALGFSTGLAYESARAATLEEVLGVAAPLRERGGLYATHMRSETAAILDAMEEAFAVGSRCDNVVASGEPDVPRTVPVVLSHLKCAGPDNWGRTTEVLAALDRARAHQTVYSDCYPYTASSSMLDLLQVDERIEIRITWSERHADAAGRSLAEIAEGWRVSQREAARRLQPAGAIYHNMAVADVRRVLRHPAVMVGSDGLPHDPRPHPRLWGTFPRVLGRFCRDEGLMDLPTAVHKMTGLPAEAMGLHGRGLLRDAFAADMVLFDPATICDMATWEEPTKASVGIHSVWVNGVRSLGEGRPTGGRGGTFLRRVGRSVA